ncbi:hypothetical protein Bhyg_04359 [Pseudolycoriella hygida]|uniref:Uncharacterized protein n=1 Tax=Pseudolycoriella hygida TaxID=35572 RepID=A0A9Q0NGJ9_9DIPT|nr:hypothetical protein Bhyg_04359 [Pseudolycoriella hygida]
MSPSIEGDNKIVIKLQNVTKMEMHNLHNEEGSDTEMDESRPMITTFHASNCEKILFDNRKATTDDKCTTNM